MRQLILLLLGCTAFLTTTSVSPVQDDVELDWAILLMACEEKDDDLLKQYIAEDFSEDLDFTIWLLKEDERIRKIMKDSDFNELPDAEWNGKTVKLAAIYESGSDDEGNEYESATGIYFENTATGIKVVGLLAAG